MNSCQNVAVRTSRSDIPTREGSVNSELHDLDVRMKSISEAVAMLRDRLQEVLSARPEIADKAAAAAASPIQCKLAAGIGEIGRYARTIDTDLRDLINSVDL